MSFSESDFYKFGAAIDFETDLFSHSSSLYKLLVSDVSCENKLFEVYLSELFSLFCKWDYFLKTNPDFEHYEFSSLSSFWTDFYEELKDAILEGDERSKSHLTKRWETYDYQHKIVDQMLRSNYSDLKEVYLKSPRS